MVGYDIPVRENSHSGSSSLGGTGENEKPSKPAAAVAPVRPQPPQDRQEGLSHPNDDEAHQEDKETPPVVEEGKTAMKPVPLKAKVAESPAHDSDTKDGNESNDEVEELPMDKTAGQQEDEGGGKSGETPAKEKRARRLEMNRASAKERRRRKRVLISSLQDEVDGLEEKNRRLQERNSSLEAENSHLKAALAVQANLPSCGAPQQLRAAPTALPHYPTMTTPVAASVQRQADEVLAALIASSHTPQVSATALGGGLIQGPVVVDHRFALPRQLQGMAAAAAAPPPPSSSGLPLMDALARAEFLAERKRQDQLVVLQQQREMGPRFSRGTAAADPQPPAAAYLAAGLQGGSRGNPPPRFVRESHREAYERQPQSFPVPPAASGGEQMPSNSGQERPSQPFLPPYKKRKF